MTFWLIGYGVTVGLLDDDVQSRPWLGLWLIFVWPMFLGIYLRKLT